MEYKKYLYILIASLFSIQSTLSKSLNLPKAETDKYLQAEKELLEFTFKNLNNIYLNYGNKVKKISENILKDFPLKPNTIEKDTLLEEYVIRNNNSYSDFEDILYVIDSVINNDEYLKSLKEKPKSKDESQIIADNFDEKVLTKISSEHLDVEGKKTYDDFLKKLQQKIEASKIYWQKDKHLEKWLANFKTLTKLDDKMEAVEELIYGLCGNLNVYC